MTSESLYKNNHLTLVNGLGKRLLIPERTRSLLWITDEHPNEISASFMGSAFMQSDSEPNNIYGEPSLIWTQMPVVPNNDLMEGPRYYPTYMDLSPREKFQYLVWLQDISQPTNLSYAYLYFYGLERHLYFGDFENAVAELTILLSAHDIGSYAYPALALSCIARNRLDLADGIPGLYSSVSDISIVLMALKKMPLDVGLAINLANRSGFRNKKYIESHLDKFKEHLQKNIKQREQETGVSFFAEFDFANCEPLPVIFANTSLTSLVGGTKIPDVLSNQTLKDAIFDLLQNTHRDVQSDLTGWDDSDAPKYKPSRQQENQRLNTMIEQLVANREKSAYANDEKPHRNGYIEYPYVSMDLSVKSKGKVYNQCIRRFSEIEALSKTDPEKSNKLALELFNEGYKSPKMYERLAINYRKLNDLKAEVELLLQMKKDFGYNKLDERLRQALSKLDKRGELKG